MEKGDIKLIPILRHGYFVFLDEVTGEIFQPQVEQFNQFEDVQLVRIEIV